MNQKLQQAMAAAQSGQLREAQILLTQILNEDPDEVQAWFLLSHLVDSEQQQSVYLKKVLELDPTHEKAVELLAQLEPDHTLPPAADTDEVGVETLLGMPPDQVVVEDEESGLEATVFTRSPVEQEDLLPLPPELFTDEPEPPAEVGTPAAADSLEVRRKQRARLTSMLVGLVILTVVVFVALVYFIITAL
jgi:hypothetical protein